MIYSGNPSLAPDVQERISSTFQQTLDLVTDQRDQEALVGCEFILRMDPEFQPAKTLVARLKSGQRPVTVEDLRTPSAPAPSAPLPPAFAAPTLDAGAGDLADLDNLESLDDLGDLDDLEELDLDDDDLAFPAVTTPAVAAPPVAAPLAEESPDSASTTGGALGTVLSDLLAQRKFEQILQIAETQKEAVVKAPELGALVEKAQGLLESEAYVQTFLKSAREAQAAGRLEDMESHLKKALALDPEHPDILAFNSDADPVPVGDPFAAESPAKGAAGPDEDLMALQQQSLSLESGDDFPPHDPRQTKPMAAMPMAGDMEAGAPPVDSIDGDAPVSFDGALSADSIAGDGVTDVDAGDLGADLFEAEVTEGEELSGETLESLDAELFDGEPQASDEPVAELTLDDLDAPDAAEPAAEGGDRVAQLLEEGQEAFERGEYQAAIDVWSRIFLIDIDNAEASDRIEEARNKKAELERQAEELFHEAVAQIENEATEDAQSTLTRVLELAPGHSLAREYLEQLESGQVPATSGELERPLTADDTELGGEAGGEANSPTLEAAVARDRVVVVKRTDKRIMALGAAVLLVVLGLGAFLKLKWDDWFPNQDSAPTMSQQARKVDPIERATKMHEGDNTENAILLLERIQPQDSIYEDAQALIAQWKALVEAPPQAADTGPPQEQVERYGILVNAAREAHKQGRHIRARGYFDRAAKILPLEPEDEAIKRESDLRLEPLEAQISLFNEGQYAAIIPVLWRRRESEPDNHDIERLIIDSYYNLALTDLQRGDAQDAAKKLSEAVEIQPDNQELQRLQLFAQTYAQRQPDLLHRIFVKYLPSR